MVYKKEVSYFDGKHIRTDMKTCHPRKLGASSRYIAPYWFQALHNVNNYSKSRQLQEVHKLVDDRRIKAGFNLYRNGHIKEAVITKQHGGDVRAIVFSEDKKKEYTVIIKDYLSEKLPQYTHEREEYIANLYIDCTCTDHVLSHYKDNTSMLCKHIIAVLFFLIAKFDMPKILVLPEEKLVGYVKSDVEEIKTDIRVLPLVKFRRFINILLMKNFRGMSNALGISIHTVNNETDQEDHKPMWLTITEKKEAVELIDGLIYVLNEMSDEEEVFILDRLQPKTKNSIFIKSFIRNGKRVKGFYRKKPRRRNFDSKRKSFTVKQKH